MSRETPKNFGRYQVIELLGEGAMGAVYRARDEKLAREVAVKTIRTAGLPQFAAEMSTARFENEARAVAALRHPNVVQVFDMGVEAGTPYLVMEVARGASLQDRIAAGKPLGPDEAARLCQQIAGALDAAHRQDIIHRDVKPGNILEAEPGVWKLADFGVAQVPDSSLTLAGQFLGSPAYAAPEAIQVGESNPQTDIYGLGATLYEALVGEPPYGKRGLMTPGALAESGPPVPISSHRDDIPVHFERAILAAVDRVRDNRPSAAELVHAAAAVLAPQALPQAMQSVSLPAPPAPPGAGPGVVHGTMASAPHAYRPGVGSVRRRRLIGLGLAIAGILTLGIIIGSSSSEKPDLPAASSWGETPTAPPRRGKHRKEWNKIQKHIRDGKYREAEKKLIRLLGKHPDDQEARYLLERVRAMD